MKKYLLILFITSCVLAGCEKDNLEPITGSWLLKSSGGGMIASPTPIVYGDGDGVIFSTNGFKRYSNGQLVESGTYTLIREKSFLPDRRLLDRIVYNKTGHSTEYAESKNGKLIIYQGADVSLDGGFMVYERGNIAISD